MAWKVENGKLIQEMPEARLDTVIERRTRKIQRLTNRIQRLKDERTAEQAKLDAANILKGELNK